MMRPLLLSLPLIVLFFALKTLGATERVVSFDELPKLIKERNENVQAAEASLSASKERTGYLTRSFLPQFSGSIGSEEFKTGTTASEKQNYWAIHGRVNLYRGGRDRLENEIRRSNEKRAKAEYAGEVNSELKEARQAYWRLLAISKILADKRQTMESNETYIKGSRRRAGAGVSTNADTLEFELQKTLLNQDIKKLTLEEDLVKNQLAVAIGLDEHENIQITGDFPHPPEDVEIPDQDPKQNLEIQKLTSMQLTDLLKKEQAARWWLPRLDLYSKYGVPSLDDEFGTALRQDREFSLGIMLTLDLGEGLENRFDSKAKGFEAIASEKRAAHKLREVRAMDHELRHDLKLLHELMHDADRDIQKAEQFLKLTQSEYSRGVKNGPDLMNALEKLYEFRERRTSLYREYHESHAELSALTARAE